MARTWHTDLRDLLEGGGPTPLAARVRERFTCALVQAATARAPGDPRPTAVRCVTRVDDRACAEWVHAVRDGDTIVWSCPGCADNGFVTHFVKSPYDLSALGAPSDAARRSWILEEEQHRLLMAEEDTPRAIEVVLASAAPLDDARLQVEATPEELARVYAHVRALMDLAPGGPRDEALEEILTSLDAALG
ncbi:MAG: hypothetical protein IT385_16800 [Deltaproteobacteria bacterium]|nr:hypothetical protein [Deltaproteobacteria bacterium]